jgi:hypothetical protein
MDRDHLEQMLYDLRRERTETEHRVATLQQRLDALRKAADGIEELLKSEPHALAVPTESRAAEPPEPVPAAGGEHSIQAAAPTGGPAIRKVLRSDPDRYWTAREVWEEEVRRSWAKPTDAARAAVRVALKRLHNRDPQVELLDGPVHAYRWVAASPAEDLALGNGSGQAMFEGRDQ